MNEMEVKVLDIDKNEIEKKLREIGATLVKDEFQYNLRFDTEDKMIKKTKNAYLRVRTVTNNITGEVNSILTFKKNISRSEIRINEETETFVSDPEAMISIIENLGFKRSKPGKKQRKSFEYEGILFEIDEWDPTIYPKPYLEIEVKCKEDLEKAITLLDLDRSKITSKPLDELAKD